MERKDWVRLLWLYLFTIVPVTMFFLILMVVYNVEGFPVKGYLYVISSIAIVYLFFCHDLLGIKPRKKKQKP